MLIRHADIDDLFSLSRLFDAYRQFYRQAPDIDSATAFVRERLSQRDSAIFLAFVDDDSLGFVQLYPSFSSVAMKPIFILNDLYVSPPARKQGIATALVNRSELHAIESGAARLSLATEVSNTTAQKLYEKLGWKKDEVFVHYNRALTT